MSDVVAARAKWYDPASALASYRNALGLSPYKLLQQYEDAGFPQPALASYRNVLGLSSPYELLQQYEDAGFPQEIEEKDAELLKAATELVNAEIAQMKLLDAEIAEMGLPFTEPKPPNPGTPKRRGRSLATRRNRRVAKNKMPSEENMLQRFEGRSRSRKLRTRSVNRK